MKYLNTNNALWLVYIGLLGILLPHTAWAFNRFEASSNAPIGWVASFAFEAALAVLTHKLSKHIEGVKRKKGWALFKARYINAYGFGLVITVAVSALANMAHAVEFASPMRVYANSPVLADIYVLAFGALLPLVSLLFARVLSDVSEIDNEVDSELADMKKALSKARRMLTTAERERDTAVQRLDTEVLNVDNVPPLLAEYVEMVAKGIVPNGEFSDKHDKGVSTLARTNSLFGVGVTK